MGMLLKEAIAYLGPTLKAARDKIAAMGIVDDRPLATDRCATCPVARAIRQLTGLKEVYVTPGVVVVWRRQIGAEQDDPVRLRQVMPLHLGKLVAEYDVKASYARAQKEA